MIIKKNIVTNLLVLRKDKYPISKNIDVYEVRTQYFPLSLNKTAVDFILFFISSFKS